MAVLMDIALAIVVLSGGLALAATTVLILKQLNKKD
jgi:hypothetical protein